MKKKLIMTRILPVLLTLAMLIGMVPFAGIGVSAADYDLPQSGDKVLLSHRYVCESDDYGSQFKRVVFVYLCVCVRENVF